ncbi:MAG: aromatic ring-hydroxylating dioxygenase subunit alpha, partial [Deltaproteobacteria bacterium]|nr:aromatic ring-hydroxylating dioxygenase subunit alpha [Deltaproteobacteria bacterium]
GEALPLWTYASEELLELEYREFFLKGWQMVGHVCDLPQAGDYISFDLWRDSVFVMRGNDGEIRAFLNICRHRASRLVDGNGNCGGAIQCPYHGWSYKNDGSLSGIPGPENFPGIDRSQFGLLPVRMEVYRGHIYINFSEEGPGVASMMGPIDAEAAVYAPESYEPIGAPSFQVWECNWKLAWDNYQENYHIPIAHPCLHRMLSVTDEGLSLSNGMNFGVFEMREKPSSVARERRYQELVACTDHRFPEGKRRRWMQIAMGCNMGIEYYPDLFVLFQVLPLGADKTRIRLARYSPPNLSAEEREMQQINLALLDEVNGQDKEIVERIQRGVRSSGYRPGPLALEESAVYRFHEQIREKIPVARLDEPPLRGTLQQKNEEMKTST